MGSMALNGASARPRLVLASASPRRLDLLEAVGVRPEVVAVDVDEAPLAGERPDDLVLRLAGAKAEAALAAVEGSTPAVVIGADTIVTVDGEIFGKPASDEAARAMLSRLSGRRHRILTGVAVATVEGCRLASDETAVWFGPLGPADIDRYVASGEHRGKAGAYAIQGRASLFVERIEGSYHSIVGLPVHLVDRLCQSAGWPLTTWSDGS
jgi:septum formation protein